MKRPQTNSVNGNGSAEVLASPLYLKEKKNKKKVAQDQLLQTTALDQLSGVVDSKELLRVLTEVKNGNFTVRMSIDQVGMSGKIYDTLNEIISLNEKMME